MQQYLTLLAVSWKIFLILFPQLWPSSIALGSNIVLILMEHDGIDTFVESQNKTKCNNTLNTEKQQN